MTTPAILASLDAALALLGRALGTRDPKAPWFSETTKQGTPTCRRDLREAYEVIWKLRADLREAADA